MLAREVQPGVFEIVLDDRTMRVKLDMLGAQFFQVDGAVPHKPERLSYHEMLAKAEKQLKLL